MAFTISVMLLSATRPSFETMIHEWNVAGKEKKKKVEHRGQECPQRDKTTGFNNTVFLFPALIVMTIKG